MDDFTRFVNIYTWTYNGRRLTNQLAGEDKRTERRESLDGVTWMKNMENKSVTEASPAIINEPGRIVRPGPPPDQRGLWKWLPGLYTLRHYRPRWLRNDLVPARTLDAADADRFRLTDSPEEAAEYVRERPVGSFGLTTARPIRRRWWLLER